MPKKSQGPYSKDLIQALIVTNDKATCRAVVAIYKRQTASEQSSERTQQHNGIGFTGADAPIMSSFAKRILRFGGLTPNQMYHAKKRMPKYWRQLIEVSRENDQRKAARQADYVRQLAHSYPTMAGVV